MNSEGLYQDAVELLKAMIRIPSLSKEEAERPICWQNFLPNAV